VVPSIHCLYRFSRRLNSASFKEYQNMMTVPDEMRPSRSLLDP
jgi:hypothetical protein